MANQIKIVFDMLAGILAGMEILIPKYIYERIDRYLLGQLQDTVTHKGSLRWLYIGAAAILTIGVILGITYSAFRKDIGQGRILETAVFILGFLAGMIILGLVTRFYRLIASLRSVDPPPFALATGIVFGISSLFVGILLASQIEQPCEHRGFLLLGRIFSEHHDDGNTRRHYARSKKVLGVSECIAKNWSYPVLDCTCNKIEKRLVNR